MSLSAISTAGTVYLDGNLLPAIKEPDFTILGDATPRMMGALHTAFEFEIDVMDDDIGKLKFLVFAGVGSTVRLTTESFLDGLGNILAEIEDADVGEFIGAHSGYSGVLTVMWSSVVDCTFFGMVSTMTTNLTDCVIWESSFTNTGSFEPDGVRESYVGLYCLHSKILNSALSANGHIEFSTISNSSIDNGVGVASGKPLGFEVEDSYISDSTIEGQGRTDVLGASINNCSLIHRGFMRISANLDGVDLKSDFIDIWHKLCLLKITLPIGDIYVFTSRTDEWMAYSEDLSDNYYNLDSDEEGFYAMVGRALQEAMPEEAGVPIIESCLKYVEDSINSRMTLMETLESPKHTGYLREKGLN